VKTILDGAGKSMKCTVVMTVLLTLLTAFTTSAANAQIVGERSVSTPAFKAQRDPSIAGNGSNYLVAWREDDGLYAGRLSLDGTIRDGTAYSLAYSTGTVSSRYDRRPADLALLRLSSSGRPIESLAISASADDDRSAALLSLGNGRVIAAYTRVAHEPLYGGVERVFVALPRPARGRAARSQAP
jgi:hypothetical protein